MSIAIIDITKSSSLLRMIPVIQANAKNIVEGETPENWIGVFTQNLLADFFDLLQQGHTPFTRDVAEVLLLFRSGHFRQGRKGVREITSTWAKEKFPEAKYEIVITLVKNDGSVVHTFLVYT